MKINKVSLKKIFIWSPMISHVGTIKASIGIANSFNKIKQKTKITVYLLNLFGEFDHIQNSENIRKLNIFNKMIFFKTGILSKVCIHIFSVLSLPFLIFYVFKHKPNVIITCLVGYLPSLLKIFFSKLKIINSIQGYPKIKKLRKILWKSSYKKSDSLITMSNLTKNYLIEQLNISEKKIYKIDNPVISRNIRLLAHQKLDEEDKFIFKKKVFCSIGRLTRQKNYLELLEGFANFSKHNDNEYNLIIIGEGEQRKILEHYISRNQLNNCFLIGFKANPYKYLSKSSLYISSSLWEEPGHTLIEAGYLNIPILTSNCPNGPKEIFQHNVNGFVYELENPKDLESKLLSLKDVSQEEMFKIKLSMKQIVSNYTEFKFAQKMQDLI